jgi:hypothetical protein
MYRSTYLLLLRLLFFFITARTIFILIIVVVVVVRRVLGRDEVLVRRVLVVTIGRTSLGHVVVGRRAVEAHGALASFIFCCCCFDEVSYFKTLGREELQQSFVLVAVDRPVRKSKCHGAFVRNRCVDPPRHRRDACSMAWLIQAPQTNVNVCSLPSPLVEILRSKFFVADDCP